MGERRGGETGKVGKRRAHGPLHGMIDLRVAANGSAEMQSEREKSGVLAGAVVGETRLIVVCPFRSANEACGHEAEAPEPCIDERHLAGLAAMGRAGERKLLVGQVEGIGGPKLHKRHRLQHLEG